MATGFDYLARAGVQNAELKADEARQAQLQNIANAGLTPEQTRDAIRTLYAGNPSALKQHIENLVGRLVGRKPQPTPMAYAPQSVTSQAAPIQVGGETLPAPHPVTVSYPGAKTQADRLGQDLAAGKTPAQQKIDAYKAHLDAELGEQQQTLQGKIAAVRKIQSDPNLSEDDKRELMTLYGIPNYRPTTDEMKRQDYQAALMGGYKGSYEQWVAEESAKGHATGNPKTLSPGAQYMRALVKKNSGQQLSPEEQAALKSYPDYIKQTSVIPGIARGQAYAEFRPTVVINPENPSQTMVVTAGQAEKGGFATPQSISYVMNSAGHKAMIPRNLGQNLASLQTAEDHLQMMQGMIDALGNGNYPSFNSAAQRWAQATGDPAPTNFDTLKTALEGEMARAYTGVGATTQEIAHIGESLDRANSPQALRGALQTADEAMAQRKKNLWAQLNQATNVPLNPSRNGPAPRKSSEKKHLVFNPATGTVD